ncbi:MAG: UvrD-helicase domain-containing protein [Candidatus Gracilibacteria bacterium]|nr:UvrD-helicase domain-containing protein [Candidatus Gracilibacteria bacterium]
MQLNPKQEEAKNQIDGPLLIIAGAGSGKTATLTARVNYMIREKGIPAQNILMVTFTNKAAREMKERICKSLGIEVQNNYFKNPKIPMLGTFHSIGIFILKEVLANFSADELQIGLKRDFVIYDETDKLSVLKGIIKNDLHLDEKQFPARQIAFYISNAKNALIGPKAYEREIDSQIKEVVHQVYTRYQDKLTQNNAIDFDDILIKTYSVLRIPRILEIYQERYRYIMVDEYQDTNMPQYEIVKMLAAKYKNLAVVGDDAQSIYSWRGADMRNILNFKKDYPDANVIKLEQNYRSTKTILSGANAVIANNRTGVKKDLWTDNTHGEKIIYIEAPSDKVEASIVAEIIKGKTSPQPSPLEERGQENVLLPSTSKEKDGGGGRCSDNLILYRTNAQSRQIEEALMIKAIPYRVIGGQKFYDRKEIKDLLAYLRIIHNPLDVVSTKRIINVPSRKIGDKSIEILDNYRESFAIDYPDIIDNIEEVEELRAGAKSSIKEFGELMRKLREFSSTLVVGDLIREIIKQIGYEAYITEDLSEEEAQSKRDNIDELINVASEYNGIEPRESLATFLEEVALITDMDSKDDREDYVTLMTIHTSKGLEQKRVFLVGLEDGIFPSFRSVNDSYALEEERRLMYVAMTRAREELYISRAKERFHFGDYVRNPESRFLKEVPNEVIENYDLGKCSLADKSFFNSTAPLSQSFPQMEKEVATIRKTFKVSVSNDISQFNMGDRVEHHKFGTGIITSLNGELAEIAFSGRGIKKMNIKIAPIKKL